MEEVKEKDYIAYFNQNNGHKVLVKARDKKEARKKVLEGDYEELKIFEKPLMIEDITE